MRRFDDENDENDGSRMPSLTAVTTAVVAIVATYQLVSWYRSPSRPNTHQLIQKTRFTIPPLITRLMKFLRPADLQKLFPSHLTLSSIPEFPRPSLNVVVSSLNEIGKKAVVFFSSDAAIEERADKFVDQCIDKCVDKCVESYRPRFDEIEKECAEQTKMLKEMLKEVDEGIAEDYELLESFIKDRKLIEEENQRMKKLIKETDELRSRIEKVEKRFHKYCEKLDKILNEIQTNPEMMRRAEALFLVLRARARFIGNLAEFFKGKLNILPEDVKEAAEQLIEYNKRFRAEIPPNPIDEILSNYYSKEELNPYQCPITLEVMMEPVKIVDKEGHECYFERLALQRYYDTVTLDDIGDYSVPTRPDLPLIGCPESYSIDEKMQSRIRSLLERIIEEKPEIDEEARSRIKGLLREMKEKSELAEAKVVDEFDPIMENPETYVTQYKRDMERGKPSSSAASSSSAPSSSSSPSLFL